MVSNVGDGWAEQFPKKWPNINPNDPYNVFELGVSRLEFEALKQEVQALKELLLAAKKFDKETNQPDCEMERKVELIKKIAKLVGVDLEDVFSKTSK